MAPRCPNSTRAPSVAGTLLLAAIVASLLAGCESRPSSVVPLTPPALAQHDAFGAAITVDPANHDLLLSWIGRDSSGWHVWFTRSADQGGTWSDPVAVSPAGEPLRLDPESPPRMVSDDAKRVGIAWSTWAQDDGTTTGPSDVRFARSLDGGTSWSAPLTVNHDSTGSPGSQSFQDITLRTEGGLFAAWLDSRPGSDKLAPSDADAGDASVWFARSDDFGAHWATNEPQWSRACPNSRVSLVVDAGGGVFAAFRKHYPGQIRDVVLAHLGEPPVRLHDDGWQVTDCPPTGPALRLSRDGTLRMAWYTGAAGSEGVWFRQSVPELMDSTATPLAVLVGPGLPVVHIGIGEAGMSGTLIACDADSTGGSALTLARIEPSGQRRVERFIVPGTQGASYPRVAAEQTSRVAYVAWTNAPGDHSTLRLLRWNIGRGEAYSRTR